MKIEILLPKLKIANIYKNVYMYICISMNMCVYVVMYKFKMRIEYY